MRIRKRITNRLCVCMLALLVTVTALPCTAFASEAIDIDRTSSLTIEYIPGNPLKDVEFQLYKVADISSAGDLTWTDDFERYDERISLDNDNQSDWQGVANALAVYAPLDKIQPLKSGKTDQNGKLSFTGLKPGLYLITGENVMVGDTTYISEASLVALPNSTPNGTWNYNVTVCPKHSIVKDQTVSRTVLKIWENDKNTGSRPESITVQLLCNGKVYDTQTLNARNGWSYTWTQLDGSYDWKVVEKDAPSGYKVKMLREGITLTITNTYQTPDNPPNPPKPPDKPKLPQTGQLWWPVPFLVCGGLVLFLIGFVYRRKRGDDEDR